MNVDTMRTIDRYLGIPLTFLLTLALRLKELLAPPAAVRPRRILFIELSEMGSTILAEPAMRKAKERLGADLHFVIFSRNRESLELTRTVPPEHVFTLRETGLFVLAWDSLRFLRWTRRQGIDTVVDLELFSRFTALLSGASGAANRAGFHRFCGEGLYRGEMLTHRVAYNPHLHIAKNFIALVNSLLTEQPELPYSKQAVGDAELVLPQVRFAEAELDRMRARVAEHCPAYDRRRHRLVLINPNASEMLPQRRWMPGRYVELIRRTLAAAPDVLVLITGAPAERDEAAELCRAADNLSCLNFAGAVRLSELPLLYSIALLMVTNDSGPAHFSSVTPLPVFVLFGPETPKLYGSLGNATPVFAGLSCSPCVSAANHRKTPCTDNKCLQAISVDQVFRLIEPLLRESDQELPSSEQTLSAPSNEKKQ